jgi:signal transduction histidine kinase
MSDESAAAQKGLAERILSLQEELASCQSDLEGFAHVVAHDLRAPLSLMLGFASLIKERGVVPEGDAAHAHLDEILRAGERIDAMLAALLVYVRNARAVLSPESVAIAELARKVWRALGKSRVLAQRAVIQIERLPPVRADPELLETLLKNLLDNALRFADPSDPRVRFGRAPDLPGDVYFVEDNGKGFDEKQRERLFLPFQQLGSSDQRGAGVGLATCARIVRRHGGQIWAECHPERGTRFLFTLRERGPQVKS